MDVPRFKVAVTCLALVLVYGCARPSGPWTLSHLPEDAIPQGTPHAEGALAHEPSNRATAEVDPDVRRAGSKIAPPTEAASTPRTEVDASEMTNLIAELQALGAIDPAVQSRLMDDLKRTDPALWPALMQSFRATLAYQRQQTPARDAMPPTELAQRTSDPSQPHPLSAPTPPLPSSPPTVAASPTSPPPAVAAPPVALAASTTSPAEPVRLAESDASADAQPIDHSTAQVAHQASLPALSPNPDNWHRDLSSAIAGLEQDQRYPAGSPEEAARQARLRLLYLVAGRRDDALRPVAGLESNQQEFWSKQLYGLSVYLDAAESSDLGRRATEAAMYLGQATSSLSSLGDLAVKSLAFCTEVKSYGVYETFESTEFKPGQETLLYAEVENFTSQSNPAGFHTALKSSYQILDAQGHLVDEHEFAVTEETCRNRRRDFFIRYYLEMPQRIYDGKYMLVLTIEDTLSKKVGQSSISFTVKGAQ